MTRGRTRHVLAAVLVALAVLAGCGGSDDEPAEAGSGTTAGDGGSGGSSGSDEGDGGDADEVTLALERVADLDPASLGSTASDDEAIYTLAYADGETTLRRIATDGTVEDLAGAGPSASLFSLFSTSEGVFATLSDQAGTCGYAPIDPATGAPGATIPLGEQGDVCSPPLTTLVEGSVVAAVVDDGLVLVDTADGTIEEATADLPVTDDSVAYSHGVTVTDDALYVVSNGYDPSGTGASTGPTVATRVDRATLEQTAQGEVPGGLFDAGTTLASSEWTDANGDDEAQAEEYTTYSVDPETLEVGEELEDPDRRCPRGELSRRPQEAGVWHITREDADAPLEVLLVAPGTCDALGSVALDPLDGETDETPAAAEGLPVGADLYVLRQLYGEDPTAPPTTVVLERVSVA